MIFKVVLLLACFVEVTVLPAREPRFSVVVVRLQTAIDSGTFHVVAMKYGSEVKTQVERVVKQNKRPR